MVNFSIFRDQVQDPLKLSHAEVKRYGLQLIFKIDISGWLVSVEAPLVLFNDSNT